MIQCRRMPAIKLKNRMISTKRERLVFALSWTAICSRQFLSTRPKEGPKCLIRERLNIYFYWIPVKIQSALERVSLQIEAFALLNAWTGGVAAAVKVLSKFEIKFQTKVWKRRGFRFLLLSYPQECRTGNIMQQKFSYSKPTPVPATAWLPLSLSKLPPVNRPAINNLKHTLLWLELFSFSFKKNKSFSRRLFWPN